MEGIHFTRRELIQRATLAALGIPLLSSADVSAALPPRSASPPSTEGLRLALEHLDHSPLAHCLAQCGGSDLACEPQGALKTGLSALLAGGWLASKTPFGEKPTQLSESGRAATIEVGFNLLHFFDTVKDITQQQLEAIQQQLKTRSTQSNALLEALVQTLVSDTTHCSPQLEGRLRRRLRSALHRIESTSPDRLLHELRDSHRQLVLTAERLGQEILAGSADVEQEAHPELWQLARVLRDVRQSTPSESTPSGSTPSGSTPSGSTPSESTPSESTPSESTPSESRGALHVFPSDPSDWKETPRTPRRRLPIGKVLVVALGVGALLMVLWMLLMPVLVGTAAYLFLLALLSALGVSLGDVFPGLFLLLVLAFIAISVFRMGWILASPQDQ